MKLISNNDQKNEDPKSYLQVPDEKLEVDWFERGERLSVPPDPRKVAVLRWEAELGL